MIHTQCNARYEKLEKETQIKISNLEECVRLKDRQHIIRANDDFIIFENLRAQVKELQMQVEKLKSVNESLNLSVEELSKARALVEATLIERDEMISAQCKKIRLLEEQSEIFHEVPSEFDSEIVHDTQDNSEKDVILSLQTQLKETAELVLNNLEKVHEAKESVLLKDIDQMKSQVSELVEKLQISNQEMKQQIVIFEEDKLILETKFKFLKHDNSLDKMIETIKKEYESNVLKFSITCSTFETKNLELVKEIGDKVKRFDDEKKVFENKLSKMEKDLTQRVKDFDDVKTELSKRTDKFETYFANLEKENALLKSQLASQNYTSLQKENNDLRTSYNVLKETHETFCEKLEKANNDLKMHYKRLFDSIKQKKVDSQVFTKSIPKVNVSEKIYMGKSSKPISKKVYQFTTYSLQKDRKYWKKQHSSETFAF
ncbi:hypothetical protein Tco_0144592 [Tanacetum coccineum]